MSTGLEDQIRFKLMMPFLRKNKKKKKKRSAVVVFAVAVSRSVRAYSQYGLLRPKTSGVFFQPGRNTAKMDHAAEPARAGFSIRDERP